MILARRSWFAMLAVSLLAGCAATVPRVGDIPAGRALPIDGVWLHTGLGTKFIIREGRMWAAEPYFAGIWRYSEGQVVTVNMRRIGPRRYEAWNPGFLGPQYLTLSSENAIDETLYTALFGVHKSVLVAVELDNASAMTADARHPVPAKNWWGTPNTTPPTGPPPTQVAQQRKPVDPPAAPVLKKPELTQPLPVPSGVSFGNYYALLIGNDSYANLPKLRSARRDVTAIDEVLRERYGFETMLLENATRNRVLLALEDYRKRLGPDDSLLVYYAGHGWLDAEADEGYWLPVDADADSSINWIPNATLTSSFKALRAKHVLVVADSCYSGKLTRGIRVKGPASDDYVNKMAAKRARIVLASGGLEPVVDGGGSGHSVFAASFLNALRENDSVLDTSALFSRVRRDVMLAADQTPELADMRKADHQGGDFLFIPKK